MKISWSIVATLVFVGVGLPLLVAAIDPPGSCVPHTVHVELSDVVLLQMQLDDGDLMK